MIISGLFTSISMNSWTQPNDQLNRHEDKRVGVGQPWLTEWHSWNDDEPGNLQSGVTTNFTAPSFLFGIAAVLVCLLWLGLIRAEQGELRFPLVEPPTRANAKRRVKWVNVFVFWMVLQLGTFVGLLLLIALMQGLFQWSPPIVAIRPLSVLGSVLMVGTMAVLGLRGNIRFVDARTTQIENGTAPQPQIVLWVLLLVFVIPVVLLVVTSSMLFFVYRQLGHR